ncbi:hypothetical protein [Bartonella sp. CB178]|uniref:hypothetical protein n=1 Tax=Bartonella sp. CB178 TaxID=3112255 RepID=UPI00300E4492
MSVPSNKVTQQDQSKIFTRMVALIQDEVDDTTAEYVVQIQDSIFTALRLCKMEPFFFSKKKESILKTQGGKTWYGQQEGLLVDSEKDIESAFLEKNSTTQVQLLYETPKILKKKYGETPPQGTPLFYTYMDKKIGLFPTPKSSVIVRFSHAAIRFCEKNVIPEDDPWMLYAFDLIKARAKYELYKNILKDPEYAAVSFNDFQEQLKALRIETSNRKNASKIISMGF